MAARFPQFTSPVFQCSFPNLSHFGGKNDTLFVTYSMQDIWIPKGIFEKIDATDSKFN